VSAYSTFLYDASMIKLSSRLKRAITLGLSGKSLTMLKAVPKFLLSSVVGTYPTSSTTGASV